jgi:hypothetical protein
MQTVKLQAQEEEKVELVSYIPIRKPTTTSFVKNW